MLQQEHRTLKPSEKSIRRSARLMTTSRILSYYSRKMNYGIEPSNILALCYFQQDIVEIGKRQRERLGLARCTFQHSRCSLLQNLSAGAILPGTREAIVTCHIQRQSPNDYFTNNKAKNHFALHPLPHSHRHRAKYSLVQRERKSFRS